jgi:3-hydroxybutyryl-CoA dehydrogenase
VGEIKTVAVIGAGIMGRGIAHAAALGGYRTILEDLLPNALRKAETEIRANLDKAVELGKVAAADAKAAALAKGAAAPAAAAPAAAAAAKPAAKK